MLYWMIDKFGPVIVGILGALLGAFGLYFGGKKAGKAEVRSEQAQARAAEAIAEAKKTVEQVTEMAKGVTDVQSDINKLDSGVSVDRLREEWNRDLPAEPETGSKDKND